jgi:hypothetical protein
MSSAMFGNNFFLRQVFVKVDMQRPFKVGALKAGKRILSAPCIYDDRVSQN